VRILLVQPAPFEPGRIGLESVFWLSEPVALTSIAAMVPEHEVRIMDMRIEEDVALNRAMLEFRPDLVGTTSMTTDCYQAKAVLEIAKGTLGEGCFTIVGGHHPTLAPADFEDDAVDAVCLGEGEETFQDLVRHLAGGGDPRALHHIPGLRFRDGSGGYVTTAKRSQRRELDTFPAPARHLVPRRYFREYFFGFLNPMASMETSRGCSFDCNFCAIWEFYERRTRFMSAATICDRLEATRQKFVFFLDDNFLTKRGRLEELCDEIERRKIRKFFAVQGRSDFIADNPELMRRLRDAGLTMVLSGYESNSDNALQALRKQNTLDKNKRAAALLAELGIVSVGVFMVRPDFEEEEFDLLYRTINEMCIAFPMVSILTPLPGTELHRRLAGELLTRDTRLFDLLHAVTQTRLPRETFYRKYAEWHAATFISTKRGVLNAMRRRPGFFLRAIPATYRFFRKELHYFPVLESHESHLRDEVGIIPIDAPLKRRPAPPALQLPVLQEGQG
jgi:radical SAM superfamily enzyme YgiQ (UPF0313 family)